MTQGGELPESVTLHGTYSSFETPMLGAVKVAFRRRRCPRSSVRGHHKPVVDAVDERPLDTLFEEGGPTYRHTCLVDFPLSG